MMNSDNLNLMMFITAIIVGVVIYVNCFAPSHQEKLISTDRLAPKPLQTGFKINNYLEIPLRISYYDPLMKKRIDGIEVNPNSSKMVGWSQITIRKGGRFSFEGYLDRNKMPIRVLKDYGVVNKNQKELNIGMVNTRELFFESSVFKGTVYEMSKIRIHNRGKIPLTFNGHIFVDAGCVYTYSGTGDMPRGVPMGIVLRNGEGIYEDFKIMRPITDIYYGLISEYKVPLYSGKSYLEPGDLN